MKKRKYIISILLVIALCFSGCGKSKKTVADPTTVPTEEPTATTAPTSTPTPEPTKEPTPEPTQEPQVTAEPTQAPVEVKPSTHVGLKELSDDIYSFQLSIDGIIYQLPLKYSEFVATGLTYEGDETTKLPSYSYTFSEKFLKGSEKVGANLINFDINELEYKDCYIGGFDISSYYLNPDAIEIIFPGGLKYGDFTYDDVKKAYGNPSDESESDNFKHISYSLAVYEDIKFTFDKETGEIEEVQMRNLVEPDDLVLSEIDDTIPEITTAYKAPTALSDNLLDYTVELAGDLYQLPAPVSEFVKNGWKIIEDESADTVAGQDSDKVTLMKDNQQFWTYVRNYSDNATAIENCFVQKIKAGPLTCDVEIKVNTSIYAGMSQKDLEKALKGYEVKKDESTSSVTFDVQDEKSLTYGLNLYCYEGILTSVEVLFDPRVSEYNAMMGVK